jgi:hypothetical protein
MTSSYSRRCKYCSRRISMRQMPAGHWVAFEGDGVHDCKRPSPQRAAASPPRRVTPFLAPAGEFEDFEISSGAGSSTPPVLNPVPASSPTPQAQPTPVIQNFSVPPAGEPCPLPPPAETNGFGWLWWLLVPIAIGLLRIVTVRGR